MMSEHQKHTEFLRHCLRYGESAEHQALEKKITQIQRDERCVQRAVWLMAILTALAVAGLGYPAILVENFPYTAPQFIVNLVCALGAGIADLSAGFCGPRDGLSPEAGPAAGGISSVGHEAAGVPPGQAGCHALARHAGQSCRRGRWQNRPGRQRVNGSPVKIQSSAVGLHPIAKGRPIA